MHSHYMRAAAVILTALAMTGCKSMGNKTVVPAGVTVPAAGEYVSLHEVMVVVDASGSMYPGTKFTYAKALTESMVRAFPDGNYRAGLLSYGGEWTFQWVDYPPEPLNRPGIERAASDLRFLTGSTPLNEAIAYVGEKYFSTNTNRALIIVSDGKTSPYPLLNTAVSMAYGGNLCIHTIQVGNDAEGGALLEQLANVTPCGSFRHGDAIATEAGMDAFIREVFFQDLAVLEVIDEDGKVSGIIGKVLFDVDKSYVKPEYNSLLDNVSQMMRDKPGMRLSVRGHADYTASNAYNMGLSERRARAVVQALVERGVSQDRLFPKAYGEEMPTAPNDTREGRMQNRRVELVVMD